MAPFIPPNNGAIFVGCRARNFARNFVDCGTGNFASRHVDSFGNYFASNKFLAAIFTKLLHPFATCGVLAICTSGKL